MRGVDVAGLARYVLRHPWVAPALVRSLWRLRARRWWTRWPFLPLPDPAYWRFRLVTAAGSLEARIDAREVITAATWSLRQRVER